MPKKKTTDPDWLAPTGQRIDSVQHRLGSGNETPAAVVGMLYAGEPTEFHQMSSQPSADSDTDTGAQGDRAALRSHRQAALQKHRYEHTMPSNFNPARHSAVVAGRPVQAHWGAVSFSAKV